jgi:hypothetical protein
MYILVIQFYNDRFQAFGHHQPIPNFQYIYFRHFINKSGLWVNAPGEVEEEEQGCGGNRKI